MYESLRPLDRTTDLPRLPAPETVMPRLNPIAIPVAPIEAAMMAERFPIAWRRAGEEWDLVALTGLLPTQDTWKPASGAGGGRIIPLLLRAYPLTVLDRSDGETAPIMVDPGGLLTPWHPAVAAYDPEAAQAELEQRLRALWTFASSRRALQPAFRELQDDGALKPWDLTFSRDGQAIAIEGFFYVDWSYMGSTAHQRLVERHGWPCARLLALHRISQHRVGGLLRDLAAQVEML
jgi:hypothetical protein